MFDPVLILENLKQIRLLEMVPHTDPIMLLGNFIANVRNVSNNIRGVIGRNGLMDPNLSSNILVNFCVSHACNTTRDLGYDPCKMAVGVTSKSKTFNVGVPNVE